VLVIAPSAIMKDSKHPNAAKLFMEFLNSIEAAKVSARHFGVPIRPEVPALEAARPIAEIKTLRLTVAEIDKGIPEVIEQWRETFGN
jgi:iron(III) transport system substrate-binding protein